MRNYLMVFFILLGINPAVAQIYQWTDGQGVVHFSDKPVPGAKVITLPESQIATKPIPQDSSAEKKLLQPDVSDEAAEADSAYRELLIVSPADEETIRNPQGYIPIVIDLKPELKKGDLLQVVFDGKPVGEPQVNPGMALQGVNRGSHTLAVQVVNAQGRVVLVSPSITIYMQPPRVGMVPQTKKSNNP